MIFVTVGGQMPFDRLIRLVDRWAAMRQRRDVFAQIGPSTLQPEHLTWTRFLNASEFRRHVQEADVVVAHAGMGSIITALELGRPILVLPRRGDLRETRNDHQIATARRFAQQGRISVAFDERELMEKLDRLGELQGGTPIEPRASDELLKAVEHFVRHTPLESHAPSRVGHGGNFDGIICFGGEDWWYHNRGHYDMQMMREFSGQMPVLYVNSIGMRTPKPGEGKMFFRRLVRKSRSLAHGFHLERKNFGVLSPLAIPGFHQGRLEPALIAWQVKRAAARLAIRSPLLWVACPTALGVLRSFPGAPLVYQRTDRYEAFPGVNAAAIGDADRQLKAAADLVLYCSSALFSQESGQPRYGLMVDHGVDFDRFVTAGIRRSEPPEVRTLPRPRIGFVGAIDAHTFDPELFLAVAQRLTHRTFVLVGGSTLPPGWCPLSHVHALGQKPYEQVADFMASCDCLIMPWNKSPWIKACNPIKLKEYLAVGRPVVSTPFDELLRFRDFVTIARTADEFAQAIEEALADPPDPMVLRRRVAHETWQAKMLQVLRALAEAGIAPDHPRQAPGTVTSDAISSPRPAEH